EDNKIEYLPVHSFINNHMLTFLALKGNPITAINTDAFKGLPMLEKLTISEVRDMKEFPDLSASVNLEVLRFDRASITKVPSYICVNLSRLRSFDVHSNRIAEIPNLSACKEALNINLGNNEITSLEGKPFKGLSELRDLTLGHNYIKYIPEDAFEGLVKLQYL
ncbi:leucine-rich repeat-containing G-protein coupled receptor 5-like, partial [Patella vulgata]|uniref:leucine-rich repeat-containing G-protein coupled receptor 5-like n=1 Tax=Patella vulgata TaxID=6465 RepID=UPI00217F90FF